MSRAGPGDEAADLLHRPLCGREPDALERLVDEALEPLQRQREVRTALRPRDGMDLVEDHGADPAQGLPCLRGEKQEEGLGRGDEDVRRRAEHLAPLARGRVARSHGHTELRPQSGERAPQVPLDVVVERLQG